jgi:hypothetical protein
MAISLRYRFTLYDFTKMKRRSYYPENTTTTATSSSPSRPVTPSINQLENDDRIQVAPDDDMVTSDLHVGTERYMEKEYQ